MLAHLRRTCQGGQCRRLEKIQKPSDAVKAMPLANLTTIAVGEEVVSPSGIHYLYGQECMNMVLALNGKFTAAVARDGSYGCR